ncbi:hypothetical protein ACH5RR_012668 [Cinchona calisaya]|uniref:Uncharacterized protein n=1 Tax=Cinchona calisaya TaxID=153742 RepID=A0ABD3A8F9_9GENT
MEEEKEDVGIQEQTREKGKGERVGEAELRRRNSPWAQHVPGTFTQLLASQTLQVEASAASCTAKFWVGSMARPYTLAVHRVGLVAIASSLA